MTPTSVTIKLAVTLQITIINFVYITFTTQQDKQPVSSETMHSELMNSYGRHVNVVAADCDFHFSKMNHPQFGITEHRISKLWWDKVVLRTKLRSSW
jgi:hypothetical protein